MPPVLEDVADEDAPPVLDQPPPVPPVPGELWAGAEGDCDGVVGLDVLDQPDELELPDDEGGGEDGRVELDQPDEPDRLPPEENEPLDRLPLDLANAAAAGPNTSTRATARARIDLDRMSALTS